MKKKTYQKPINKTITENMINAYPRYVYWTKF